MKKTTLLIALIAVCGLNHALAQWAANGTNIYNTNSGFVGIGTNSPATLLYVAKNMTEPNITVRNLGGTGGATYTMTDNLSGANWKFKATTTGGFKIRDHANSLDVIVIEPNSAANSLYINANGYVGVGKSNPAYLLDVNGDALISGVRVGIGGGYGYNCTALGNGVLQNNSNVNNTGVGYQTLFNNSTGYTNTGCGLTALYSNTTGNLNTALGSTALYYNTEGSSNTALGPGTLYQNTTGSSNIAIGRRALYVSTDRSGNIAIGDSSLYNNGTSATGDTQASKSVAIGVKALYTNTTGYYNTATGYQALQSNLSGFNNVAMGYQALMQNSSGSYNTQVGVHSSPASTGGNYNTSLGFATLFQNGTGNGNTAIGMYADYYVTAGYNTAVGYSAGDNYTMTNGTFLGAYAYPSGSGYSNCMALGYDAHVNASNKVVVGNPSVTSIGGYAGWTNFSDGRYKKNVSRDVPGLDFIQLLHPVTYNLDVNTLNADQRKGMNMTLREGEQPRIESAEDRAAAEAKSRIVYTGFIAQEVEQAAKSIGYDFSGLDVPQSPDGYYGLRYSDFVVPLVKAVQELKAENDELRRRIEELEKK